VPLFIEHLRVEIFRGPRTFCSTGLILEADGRRLPIPPLRLRDRPPSIFLRQHERHHRLAIIPGLPVSPPEKRARERKTLRLLTLIDEYTRNCLAIRVSRRLNSYDLIETLADLMLLHGIPEHMRSDNGPEFVAERLRKWLSAVGAKMLYIEPGSKTIADFITRPAGL
jgi:transposase InsO family protein